LPISCRLRKDRKKPDTVRNSSDTKRKEELRRKMLPAKSAREAIIREGRQTPEITRRERRGP